MSDKTSPKARRRVAILIPSDCKAHRERIAGILRYFASHPHLEAVLTGDHVANRRLSDLTGLKLDGLMTTPEYLCQSSLMRRFQEVLGKTPIDELRDRRLEHVCEMLTKTTTPIDLIGSFCGFNSNSNLKAAFKARYGMSLSDYRGNHA